MTTAGKTGGCEVAGSPQDALHATLGEADRDAPEVSTGELRRILAERSAIVLDTRPFNEYAVGHIPGASNVSAKPGVPISVYVSDAAEVDRLSRGDKGRAFVLYCNGPFCVKTKRLAAELLAAGYTNVRRYQLGIPVWRALGGVTQIEPEGLAYVYGQDRTAVFVDARSPEEFSAGSVGGAHNVPLGSDLERAKDARRLPVEDHNTRVVMFGRDGAQARALAGLAARQAFHNVAFFDGTFAQLGASIGTGRRP